MAEPQATDAGGTLLAPLQRLDRLLARAIAAAEVAYGPEAASDPYRGLHLGRDEVEYLLARSPGTSPLADPAPTAAAVAPAGPAAPSKTTDRASNSPRGILGHLFGGQPAVASGGQRSVGEHVAGSYGDVLQSTAPADATVPDLAGAHLGLRALARAFGLSSFDLAVLVIALAPELDLRYERLYAYLQDDVTRRRPTVDLALNLLAASAEERWSRRTHFTPDAPLMRHGLVHLAADSHQLQPPLLSQYLTVDTRLVEFLLGHDGVDGRLHGIVRAIVPHVTMGRVAIDDTVRMRLKRLAVWYCGQAGRGEPASLVLLLHGPNGAGRRAVAEAFAGEVGAEILVVNVAELLRAEMPIDLAVRLVVRESVLAQAPMYWDGFERLLASDERAEACRTHVMEHLAGISGLTFLASESAWAPSRAIGGARFVRVPVSVPTYGLRRELWAERLNGRSADLDAGRLASQFRFGPGQVRDAMATATDMALWRDPDGAQLQMDDLLAACRVHSNQRLATVAQRVKPVYSWDDIVLPADPLAQLGQICHTVRFRATVYDAWGFERKLARGKGVNALFAGPSGTGKTMAAEVIASDLGLDLYRIDLSAVVSKYIGETEKNLERIFREAETSNAILFFDEADALFGKRSEVKDAHDRYANIEIAYLLQRMEDYGGVAILATNLRQNIDDAFVRRLQFVVDFPFPDEADRERIWQVLFPSEAPRAGDLDFTWLGRQFRMTGGSIKNVVLGAAFLAAADGGDIGMGHVVQATRREFRKMGKSLPEAELAAYTDAIANATVAGGLSA